MHFCRDGLSWKVKVIWFVCRKIEFACVFFVPFRLCGFLIRHCRFIWSIQLEFWYDHQVHEEMVNFHWIFSFPCCGLVTNCDQDLGMWLVQLFFSGEFWFVGSNINCWLKSWYTNICCREGAILFYWNMVRYWCL